MAPESRPTVHWPRGGLAAPQGERGTHTSNSHLTCRAGWELNEGPSWTLSSERDVLLDDIFAVSFHLP